MHLFAAGNTVAPAIQTLRSLGYKVTLSNGTPLLIAEKDGNLFVADDPVTVLGLIKMHEIRGDNWQASDEELEEVRREFRLF